MGSVEESVKFKREFLLINFSNTIELRAKKLDYIANLKYWVVILWNSAIGLALTKDFNLLQIHFLLIALVFTFFILHLVILSSFISLQETIELMEKFLLKGEEMDTLQEPLFSLVVKEKIKRNRFDFFFIATSKTHENIFFYLLFIISLIVPFVFPH